MVQENLHERGAVQVWQARNFTDNADVAKALDGFAIFAVLVAYQDDAVHGEFGGVQRGQREQSVIDGAEAAAGREDYRQFKFGHEIEHKLLRVDGNVHAADAFDHQPIVDQAGGQVDARQIDLHASPARGKIRRDRWNELIDLVESAVVADAREAHDLGTVGTFERAGLNGLPIDGVERGAQ